MPLTVASANGTHRFTVEVAATPAQQEYGLMNRQNLAPDHGMIFPFAQPTNATFWMKDTLIPLDLLFVRGDGTIANIAVNAQPMNLSLIPSVGPVTAVLELAGGRSGELGIRAGDKVSWPH